MKNNQEKFDVAVIGGGPAGMMAAGKAAELGAKVVLLEKNATLGKKLLITGHRRCNLTNAEFDDRKFIEKLGDKKSKFLFSALAAFGPKEVIEFFESKNLKTKVEKNNRVFPSADNSCDVLDVLQKYLKDGNVKIIFNAEVQGFERKEKEIKSVQLKDKQILADKFILCTGGKSYSVTGSTGDGYKWAKDLGHNIIEPMPALVPIKTKETWVKDVQGLSFVVDINLIQNNKKQYLYFGEILFTHFGLSGPAILNISKKVEELAKNGEVIISLDVNPDSTQEQLDEKLKKDFQENSNKNISNYLTKLLPQKMADTILKLSGIEMTKKIHAVTKEERKKIINSLKDLRLTFDGTTGFNQAMLTSGGVDLKEVDSKTMQSKIIKNLFFAGEILDLDGPTGGFNLQICWSTGHAAGTYAINGKK
jgi:hypothetical protein